MRNEIVVLNNLKYCYYPVFFIVDIGLLYLNFLREIQALCTPLIRNRWIIGL